MKWDLEGHPFCAFFFFFLGGGGLEARKFGTTTILFPAKEVVAAEADNFGIRQIEGGFS